MRKLVLILALLTSGCGDASAPVPEYGCVKFGEPYSCRGGPCYPCVERAITCPKPTEVKAKDEKLVCLLPEKES